MQNTVSAILGSHVQTPDGTKKNSFLGKKMHFTKQISFIEKVQVKPNMQEMRTEYTEDREGCIFACISF
jgi:hypothetical protein